MDENWMKTNVKNYANSHYFDHDDDANDYGYVFLHQNYNYLNVLHYFPLN